MKLKINTDDLKLKSCKDSTSFLIDFHFQSEYYCMLLNSYNSPQGQHWKSFDTTIKISFTKSWLIQVFLFHELIPQTVSKYCAFSSECMSKEWPSYTPHRITISQVQDMKPFLNWEKKKKGKIVLYPSQKVTQLRLT